MEKLPGQGSAVIRPSATPTTTTSLRRTAPAALGKVLIPEALLGRLAPLGGSTSLAGDPAVKSWHILYESSIMITRCVYSRS